MRRNGKRSSPRPTRARSDERRLPSGDSGLQSGGDRLSRQFPSTVRRRTDPGARLSRILRHSPGVYPLIAASLRGLGELALEELRTWFGDTVQRPELSSNRNFDLLRFDFAGPPEKLIRPGIYEDLFSVLAEIPLTGSREELPILAEMIGRLSGIEEALALHRKTIPRPLPARTTFRVVVQAQDAEWRHYRRVEMQRVADRAIGARQPRWKSVADDADLEFWLQVTDQRLFITLRLSELSLRQRGYEKEHRPASLRPTVAHALLYLVGMEETDIFLDPFCGSGTILLERAISHRYLLLLGGDIDPAAVATARANFGPRHKPWDLQVWDARRLPIERTTIDRIATNPPWGIQIGAPEDLAPLYRGFLQEAERVLRPGGRIALITGDRGWVESGIAPLRSLTVRRAVPRVSVLGTRATLMMLQKQ